uniref:Uncharacterized protein n=1 Tax=Suricata suricatta TaxID=37032 RepID=A0A673U7G0_SURSU
MEPGSKSPSLHKIKHQMDLGVTGRAEVTTYHTPKKGVGPGVGHTGSFGSSLSAAVPAFPKQQVPPGWGPT